MAVIKTIPTNSKNLVIWMFTYSNKVRISKRKLNSRSK